MVELLEIFLVFAVATGVTSYIFLFRPVIKKAKLENINNEFTTYPIISGIIYTVIASIMSPILFVILLFPDLTASYLQGISKVIREEKS